MFFIDIFVKKSYTVIMIWTVHQIMKKSGFKSGVNTLKTLTTTTIGVVIRRVELLNHFSKALAEPDRRNYRIRLPINHVSTSVSLGEH